MCYCFCSYNKKPKDRSFIELHSVHTLKAKKKSKVCFVFYIWSTVNFSVYNTVWGNDSWLEIEPREESEHNLKTEGRDTQSTDLFFEGSRRSALICSKSISE